MQRKKLLVGYERKENDTLTHIFPSSDMVISQFQIFAPLSNQIIFHEWLHIHGLHVSASFIDIIRHHNFFNSFHHRKWISVVYEKEQISSQVILKIKDKSLRRSHNNKESESIFLSRSFLPCEPM